MRRCAEKIDDFGLNPERKGDPQFFPIYLRKDDKGRPIGTDFGFCPGKATWYPQTQKLFRLLILAAETGQPLFDGGLAEQPDWVTELLTWFVPDYLEYQFQRRAKSIFGSKDGTKTQ